MSTLSIQAGQIQPASLIFESIVPRDRAEAFQNWHANLRKSAQQFKGYIRTDLCPPVKAEQLKWYSIMHFESADHLSNWLNSEIRQGLIAEGKEFIESYQFKSFTTGLEGWFSHRKNADQLGLDAPAWKQNLAVILGLYPTVMLQSLLFTKLGMMQHWPFASSMLINNIISTSILTWVVMPSVTKAMNFWLQPAPNKVSIRMNLFGTALATVLPAVMMFLFNLS
jgi:antibiotic biosynthesis monooxygenase (ABM) superfamily enzyme